jgi:predicted nucleotidyltransferase
LKHEMIDIAPRYLETVREILSKHVPECEVRAFGSRVVGEAKTYSDLDIALKGEVALDQERLNRLVEAFEESDLPFRVDVLDWNAISESFQAVIEKRYEIISA